MAALPPQDPTCWYDANFDEELVEVRRQAEHTCWLINQLDPQDAEKHQQLLGELFGSLGVGVEVLAPVMVDYGTNVSLGDGCFVNHNAYFMDGAPIVLGAHVFVGPDCGFYTANHPLLASERNQGWEQARPITIQDNVWIGAKGEHFARGDHWRRRRGRCWLGGDQGCSSSHAGGRKPLQAASPHHCSRHYW